MKETPPFSMAGPHIRSGLLESTSFQKSGFGFLKDVDSRSPFPIGKRGVYFLLV
jgi:hypothetical protein